MSKVLDEAAKADRAASFAALQAAMLSVVDIAYRIKGDLTPKEYVTMADEAVLRALTVGDTYGSPRHLASIEARGVQGGTTDEDAGGGA